MSLIPTRKVPA